MDFSETISGARLPVHAIRMRSIREPRLSRRYIVSEVSRRLYVVALVNAAQEPTKKRRVMFNDSREDAKAFLSPGVTESSPGMAVSINEAFSGSSTDSR